MPVSTGLNFNTDPEPVSTPTPAPARTADRIRPPHRVAVLALEGALPMEIGMPFHILARTGLPYEVLLCGRSAGPVATDNGWTVTAPHGLELLRSVNTIVVPAFRDFPNGAPDDVTTALREAAGRGARIASICTGAFALAAAGLLDGLAATTHWMHADRLARAYPRVHVDPDALFVDAGDVLTSAGVASGIDLCLHLVRRDHGAAVANRIAREIVAAPHRDGGQAQFIRRPRADARHSPVSRAQDWALGRLAHPLTVADLAAHARLSPRSFARSFAEETGTTPIRWLNDARVDRARELLETTDATATRIARQCGLGSPANFRQRFRAVTGVTPGAYRRTFAPEFAPTFTPE